MESPLSDIPVIRVSYEIPLDRLVYEHATEPDDTWVEFTYGPYIAREDGTYGPFRLKLGRLREEFFIRQTFPLTFTSA